MSKIQVLSSGNFIVSGRQRKTMGLNMGGVVLVYFKSTGSQPCANFEPIFHQLASKDGRIMCAICDVAQYKDIIQMSRDTTTPIQTVPLLILYINGRPHAKFTGQKTLESVQKFISDALANNSQAPPQTMSSVHPPQFVADRRAPQYPPVQSSSAPYAGGGSQQNMYGGYNNPPPQAQPAKGKIWEPEIGHAPSMKNVLKSGGSHYARINNDPADDDEEKMLMPEGIIPHNKPWEADYARLDGSF